MKNIGIIAGGGIIAVVMLALVLGLSFGMTALLTWGIVWAAEGFGYSLPYWPSAVGLWIALLITQSIVKAGKVEK